MLFHSHRLPWPPAKLSHHRIVSPFDYNATKLMKLEITLLTQPWPGHTPAHAGLMNMVKSLFVLVPLSTLCNQFWGFCGKPWDKFCFSLLFLLQKLLLYSQSATATCFKGLQELRKDGETRQQVTLKGCYTVLIGVSDTWNKYRDSRSGFVDFSDCLSHYRLLTTSPWLSLAVSFSHILKGSPMQPGCCRGQTLSWKICLSATSLSFPGCERHFLSFSVLCAHVRHLLTLFLCVR